MHFRDYILLYTLVPLIVGLGVVSYVRFIVNHDYIVAYEGRCDPAIESCFIGCEDDACTTTYYYAKVQKYAADLYAQCGKDITGCEAASMCFSDDRQCSITHCDVATDGEACEALVEEPDEVEDAPEKSEEEITM